jgi:nucleoside-diphosphate kinase
MSEFKKERTLVLIKPDGVQRALVGEVVGRLERVGLKIVGMKFLLPTKDQAHKHYVKNEAEIEALGNRSIEGKRKSGIETNENPKELGQRIINRLVAFLSAGPIAALVLEGNRSVAIIRKLVGSTEPLQSDVGTIRGDYTIDSYALADEGDRAVRNLIHASANVEEADYEIKVWFKDEELINYKNSFDKILYDVNLDGVLE